MASLTDDWKSPATTARPAGRITLRGNPQVIAFGPSAIACGFWSSAQSLQPALYRLPPAAARARSKDDLCHDPVHCHVALRYCARF